MTVSSGPETLLTLELRNPDGATITLSSIGDPRRLPYGAARVRNLGEFGPVLRKVADHVVSWTGVVGQTRHGDDEAIECNRSNVVFVLNQYYDTWLNQIAEVIGRLQKQSEE